MSKQRRRNDSRMGRARRRRLEFEAVLNQVKTNKARFIARIQRMCVKHGDCLLHQGTKDHKGYPRMSIKYQGKHFSIQVMRVVAILQRGSPIPRGYEASHCCPVRPRLRTCIKHIELLHYSINAGDIDRV